MNQTSTIHQTLALMRYSKFKYNMRWKFNLYFKSINSTIECRVQRQSFEIMNIKNHCDVHALIK
jgi:hypothetical protein